MQMLNNLNSEKVCRKIVRHFANLQSKIEARHVQTPEKKKSPRNLKCKLKVFSKPEQQRLR